MSLNTKPRTMPDSNYNIERKRRLRKVSVGDKLPELILIGEKFGELERRYRLHERENTML
jgi:hypothetical protein